MPHDNNKGYAYNYLHDASHCYWAARLLELNYRSIDEKDKMIDELLVRRLRTLANNLTEQAINGLKPETVSASEGLDLLKQLTSPSK